MPVLDGSFEAFVTNLGKYNEGELVGEWVHFPTTEEDMLMGRRKQTKRMKKLSLTTGQIGRKICRDKG